MKALAEAPREAPESFAALAAAVHPNWHDAILRLANSLEGISGQLHQIRECQGTTFVACCRSLVTTLIEVLDAIDGDPDLEPTFGYPTLAAADECEAAGDDEPDLGWTGRTNQTHLQAGDDRELDTADDEPSLGSLEEHCCCDGWWPGPNPTGDQTLWGYSPRSDLEEQCEDEGSAA